MFGKVKTLSSQRPRRLWWQRALRAVIIVAILMFCAYATLPYWLPKGFIKRQLIGSLSAKLGLPVGIAKLDISWSDGIWIEGFHIGSGVKGVANLVDVGEIRADFSPVQFWVTHRTQWAQLSRLRINAVIDESGNVNLARLSGLKLGSPPEHVIIRDGLVSVQLPRQDRQLELSISDLQYHGGRFDRMGRVVMYARLKQPDQEAPITLLAGDSPVSGETSACRFAFRQVNLQHLDLPVMLGLPLRQLSGLATGRLDCQVNSLGMIDQFTLDVQVQDLNAQPARGPALPVIAKAEIQMEAVFDLVFKQMEFRSFRLKLPGIDVSGKGRLHEDIFAGSWQGVRDLSLQGRINPSVLATLLQGGGPLPLGLNVEGDVGIHMTLEAHDTELLCSAGMDAKDAKINLSDRVIKPRGTVLVGEFRGSLETATGHFTADKTELQLGGNIFRGSGAMENVLRMAWQTPGSSQGPTLHDILSQLAMLDWSGSWEINDLASLRDLAGPGVLDDVKLDGRLVGEWNIERGGVFDLHGLRAPAGTRLQWGDWFVKPAEAVMRLEISGKLSGESGLSRMRLVAGVGEGELEVELQKLNLSTGDQGEPVVSVEGDYDLQDAQRILQCISGVFPRDGKIDGASAGHFQAAIGPRFRRLHVESDVTQMEVTLGDAFTKAAGQAASLVADLRSDGGLDGVDRNQIDLRLKMNSMELENSLSFGPSAGQGAQAVVRGHLEVADMAWLLERMPALHRRLRDEQLRGPVTLRWNLRDDGQSRQGEILLRADDLEFFCPATGGKKARGTPLHLRLAGASDSSKVTLSYATLDFGKSSIQLTGEADLADAATRPARPPATQPGGFWPPPKLQQARMHINGSLTWDAAAAALLPEMARVVSPADLKGALQLNLRAVADRDGVTVEGSASGDEISFTGPDVRKPAPWPLALSLRAKIGNDLKNVRVNDLVVDCPAFQLRAGLNVPILAAGPVDCHLAWNCPDVEKLSDVLPAAEAYKATGSLLGEAEMTADRASGEVKVKYLALTADDLQASINNRDFRANGSLRLERPALTGELKAERVVCEDLEVTLGCSHGFVTADVQHPWHNPIGQFTLLFENLDLVELLDAPPQGQLEPTTAAATQAATSSGPAASEPAGVLAARAEQKCRSFLNWCRQANLHGTVQADSLRYYESGVKAYYTILGVVANFDIEGELLAGGFRAGLNGGQIEQRYRMNLKEWPLLLVSHNELHKVEPLENIQLQLSQEFPGNTVSGSFSRQDDLTFSLQSMIMSSMDGHYKAIPVGSAVTITEDGVVRGKGGPAFLTRIFPGLNLATYPYKTMTGFAEYAADGTATNDMIFDGASYNLYMEGTTDINKLARYQIGLILTVPPQSVEYNHRYRQGRIPVMDFKARLAKGKFVDEEINFPLPTETAFTIFVKNNYFVRMWLESRDKPKVQVPATQPVAAGGT